MSDTTDPNASGPVFDPSTIPPPSTGSTGISYAEPQPIGGLSKYQIGNDGQFVWYDPKTNADVPFGTKGAQRRVAGAYIPFQGGYYDGSNFVPTDDGTGHTTVPYTYYQGDENSLFAGLDPSVRVNIKQAMYALGIYNDKVGASLPGWDSAAASAASQLLAGANVSGTDWQSYLTDEVSKAQANGGLRSPKAGSGLPQVRLTSATDLNEVARAVSKQVLRREVGPDDMAAFVNAFHQQQEAAAYSRADPANPNNAAADFARTQHAGEAATYSLMGQMDTFLNMIGAKR